ncbi:MULTISPECIES: signal peptide peptidase SppA [unclassified Mesorhizobium]|uniref:signal peptide peptidase SppA n=1 Tax=unclassified Mesorhizobium TaxID=325217 RepID=UPI00112785BD|nr:MULTISPECIES: signal peptide peptidase SppA [unclassified Mesorhizobium]MBZ9700030.1 signal peptide peptidase SppA [Mesorhizobium sp. CO1-1-3]MBZ9896914.1 signal peptide peptidase SppA [Mesorhizobium sp. BR1-1-6]MBZ9946141.1 signal peptide peptidase SppA [Mesorhizobium sp. BR1-1-11]MBZ9959392.1 signal peptide peptidase SppA [Mesorhizobium sp. BR1-1-14]MCA0028911.1 signal peptide peptidase SppA [Mesorhizobium sp. B263B1A]
MALRADDLIDRRRLRRKLTFWRAAAIAIVALGVIAISAWFYRDDFGGSAVDHIAKVRIEGTITEDDELIERLEAIRKSPRVKGVILAIDSPGGTTVGGESIYEEVRKLAADKPVAAEVGTLAASAGYMIASATDHIVARKTSIVGSIGVLIQYPDVSGLMDKLGVKLEEVKSSPLKASPSPFKPTNDDERAMVRKLILDSYDWFVGIVAERRKMTREQALALADGSIFTGRQGVANGLIDAVGGETEAIDWLATKGVDSKLKVVEWKDTERRGGFLFSKAMVRTIAGALGLPDYSGDIIHELGADRLFLDGLVSVWHP